MESGLPSRARRRVDALLDTDTFTELSAGNGDAITGFGTIEDRPVCVFSDDGRSGGSRAVGEIVERALTNGCPVIGLFCGQDPARDLTTWAHRTELLSRQTRASGVIPQLAVIIGETSSLAPALADFVIMVEGSARASLHSPEVIEAVTGENVDAEAVGGALIHGTATSLAHHLAGDEADAFAYARALLSFLPQNNLEDAPLASSGDPYEFDDELESTVPAALHLPYDVRDLLTGLLDEGDLLEVHARFAPNLVVGFGRIEGRSVGVVANQPAQQAGSLDVDAATKGTRFVRTCDAFNLPVITITDVPGFVPGAEQVAALPRAAGLAYAYAEATVPLITVITRKAVGTAYAVMGSKALGADLTLAWPQAQIRPTDAQQALDLLHSEDLAASSDPDELRADLAERAVVAPGRAVEQGMIDAVIEPGATRAVVARALRLLRSKRRTPTPKKHGTLPW